MPTGPGPVYYSSTDWGFDSAFNSASGYANSAVSAANSFLSALGSAVNGLAPPSITPSFPSPGSAPALTTPIAPILSAINVAFPTSPSAFSLVFDDSAYEPEPINVTPPTANYGTAPVFGGGIMPAPPAVDTALEIPELGEITLPSVPDLLRIETRSFAGIDDIEFDSDEPVLELLEPSIERYTPGAGYTSSLLTAASQSLESRIVDGGTGLNPLVEGAIWDRAREREALATADALASLDQMESLGFALPPGIYLDARNKITTEMAARTTTLSRDIAIKQAELEMENVKLALSTAVQLESQLMNYSNSVEQRAFDAVKYATEAAVSLYNAKVQAFGVMMEAYKARVNVYEARIRGELAKVEAYKAEMEVERVKADVNTALVQQYKAQVEAALSEVKVFEARVAAVQSKAELEKLKVMVFAEEIKAFTGGVNAYAAQVEAYKSTVQVEGVKQEAYKTAVSAYAAKSDATTKLLGAKVEAYKAKVAAKSVEWDGYKAAVAAAASNAQVISAQNSTLVDAFKANSTATSAYNEVLVKQWQVSLDQAQRVSEIGVSAAKANAELYMTSRSLAAEAAKVGAQVNAQIAAAAMNAVNYSSSRGLNIGLSSSSTISNNTNYDAAD